MTRGKIVLIPFPFDDLSATKVRPALCLTNPLGPHHHIVLAFLTSTIPADLLDTDIVLDNSHHDFATTGLRAAATLRLHRLMTVSTSLILRQLGVLPASVEAQVSDKLAKLFELPQKQKPDPV